MRQALAGLFFCVVTLVVGCGSPNTGTRPPADSTNPNKDVPAKDKAPKEAPW